jgi:ABC-type polysaccharide/polyol phosphate export permease
MKRNTMVQEIVYSFSVLRLISYDSLNLTNMYILQKAIYRKRKNYFFLIEQFAITDFKMRYSKSFLGYIWSLINPLFFFFVYYVVFSVLLRFNTDRNYPIYLLTGILIWNFFSETTQSGMRSIFYKSSLLTKVKFPLMIIPVSSLVANTLIFLINIVVLFVCLFFIGVDVHYSVGYLLVVLLNLVLFSHGVTLILCSFYLKFRDLEYIWGILLQLGFWLTPIVYKLDIIPAKYVHYIMLNPMTHIIINFQEILINGHAPALKDMLQSFIIAYVTVCIGAFIFDKTQHKFSEWV